MSASIAKRVADLVNSQNGVPPSSIHDPLPRSPADLGFDSALVDLVQEAHTWVFAKALRDAVAAKPTPRGWSIAGYALAASGYLKDAIAALKKGQQSNTTHEMIASCLFVLDKCNEAVRESRESSDSLLHEWQLAFQTRQQELRRSLGPYKVNPIVWTMSLVYILERPPVFGAGPQKSPGVLQLMDLAVRTLTSMWHASSGNPIIALELENHLEAWRSMGVDAAPDMLGRMMGEWQAAFQQAVGRSSVSKVIQETVSSGRLPS